MTALLSGATVVRTGSVVIGPPVKLDVQLQGANVVVSWPRTLADTMLEATPELISPVWTWVTNSVATEPGKLSVVLPASNARFLRVSRAW